MKNSIYILSCFILFLSLTSCSKDDRGFSVASSFITNYYQIENYELTYDLDLIVDKMMNEPEKYLIIHSDDFAEATDEIFDEMVDLLLKHFDYQISDNLAKSLNLNRYIRNVITIANENGYTISVDKVNLEKVKSSDGTQVYNHNSEITITYYNGSAETKTIKGQILLEKEDEKWKVYQYTEY